MKAKKKTVKKTKKPKVRTTASLTFSDVKTLARALLQAPHTNVYHKAEELFGIEKAGDEIFDRLCSEAKIFKCQECSRWMPLSELAPGFDEMCINCIEMIDENM